MVDTESIIAEAIERSKSSVETLRKELNRLADIYGPSEINAYLQNLDWNREEFAKLAEEIGIRTNMSGQVDVLSRYADLDIRADFIKLPFKEAIDSFLKKEVMSKAAFDQLTDAYKRKSFTVANLLDDYAIESVKKVADQAMREGWSKGQFKRAVRESPAKYGFGKAEKYHLDTVFRTNVQTAFGNGRWRQLRTPSMMQRRPFWKYVTADDPRVRPSHAEMAGKIYPADHTIWHIWFPPNGFNCRCSVEALSAREVRRFNTEWPSDDDGAPLSPDLGFATNPDA